MNIKDGGGKTQFGTGVDIELSGGEVSLAIDAWLLSKGVVVSGPRTVRVNGEIVKSGKVYVDPSGFVVKDRIKK